MIDLLYNALMDRDMTQWLRPLLFQDSDSIPSIHMKAYNHPTLYFKDIGLPLLAFMGTRCAPCV